MSRNAPIWSWWTISQSASRSSLALSETIHALKVVFARHGIPEVLGLDNRPQYDSAEFAKFTKDWEFKHVTSSPLYAQSNWEAEQLFKQRWTCWRRRATLPKLFLDIDPHPCKMERACLSYSPPSRFNVPFLTFQHPSNQAVPESRTGSKREVKERSSKNSIMMHGTESRSYIHCSSAIKCGSQAKTSQAQSGSSSWISRTLTQ